MDSTFTDPVALVEASLAAPPVRLGPFFRLIDRLSRAPLGIAATAADPAVQAQVRALTPAQHDALFSADWGRIHDELIAENPDLARLSASPLIGWNFFTLPEMVAALRTVVPPL